MRKLSCFGLVNAIVIFCMNKNNLPSESESLQLLDELQSILSDVLNDIEIKSIPKLEARYLVWAAISIKQAAHGYIILRKANSLEASKLLIRPIMESFIYTNAVMKNHGFLYRKYHSELLEEKKLPRHKTVTEADIKKEMDEATNKAKTYFKTFDANYPFTEKKVNVSDAAKLADLSELYDVGYRVYCKFTHGAMIATTGGLNEITEDVDTPLVASFLLLILDLLQRETPAKVPDLEPYKKRLPKSGQSDSGNKNTS